MTDRPKLIWPGTGEEMEYDPTGHGSGPWECGAWRVPGYRTAGLSANGYSWGDGYTRLTHEGRLPTQSDADALHARLTEQHDALGKALQQQRLDHG